MAALLSLALVAGLVAWQQKRVGDERARQASARTLASIAESLRTTDPDTAALPAQWEENVPDLPYRSVC
ncbi:hypothetical protein OG264_35370 [Streptomyces xanthophaeus]|uniref:hypothetical protein n=1 Tax=Streptomyces xanthophaeus TaxID=67385 RepID=UPI00386994CD|nr:hypothetical protein OG264_35370 [Streptomyces xanthophaeus]WST58695.1 hypothetical protein OG605_03065 [Streptomyces xanthophaeus]